MTILHVSNIYFLLFSRSVLCLDGGTDWMCWTVFRLRTFILFHVLHLFLTWWFERFPGAAATGNRLLSPILKEF